MTSGRIRRKRVLLAGASGLAALLAFPALAQTQEAAGEEIVITARKRAEQIQQAPVTVSAYSEAEIKSAKIENLADIAQRTPGLNFTPLFGAQNQLPIIRGAAQTFGALNVGVFLDGVYLTGKGAVDLELNDLERVEVVKGPQSALYGRNTFSGAINYVTKAPSRTFEASAEATVGENGLRKAIASMSGPLSDTLALRVGAYGKEFDGFYTSVIDGGQVDFQRVYGAILTLEAQPTDQFTATVRLSASDEDSGQPPSNVIRTNSTPTTVAAGQTRNRLYVGEVPAIAEDGVLVNTKTTGLEPSPYGQRNQIFRFNLTLENEFDAFTATSITAYSARDTEYTLDGDNTICDRAGGCPDFGVALAEGRSNFSVSSEDQTFRDFSQEVRIQSPANARLQWLAGLYFFDSDSEALARSYTLTTASRASYAFAFSLIETESFAQFASLGYDITDKLTATVEVRHEHEQQAYVQRPTNAGTAFVYSGPSTNVFDLSQSFDFVTPRATIDYQLTPDTLVFATVGKGVKAGGFNTASNITPEQRTYDEEESLNYEIGAKNDLFDRRLRANVALYYTDWQNQQVACQNPGTGGSTNRTYTCNVGEASVWGVELDGVWRITEAFEVSGNYAYTRARYQEFVDDSLAAVLSAAGLPAYDFDGRSLPYVPEHKVSLSPRYTLDLAGDTELEFRLDAAYQTKTYVRADNLQSFGEKTVVDVRATYSAPRWWVQAFVDNAFDDDTPVAAVRFFDSTNYSVAAPLVTGADRRLAGATLGVRF